MKHEIPYIKLQTIHCTQGMIDNNKLITHDKYNNIEDEDRDDLHTIQSHHAEMMEMWTLDFDYDDETITKIEMVVTEAILSMLPDELKENYT